MVKLNRNQGKPGGGQVSRSKPRPLFPPGELPLFGPPPAYGRRPPVPPAPPLAPPPPPPGRRGPPLPPPNFGPGGPGHHHHHHRHGGPPPPPGGPPPPPMPGLMRPPPLLGPHMRGPHPPPPPPPGPMRRRPGGPPMPLMNAMPGMPPMRPPLPPPGPFMRGGPRRPPRGPPGPPLPLMRGGGKIDKNSDFLRRMRANRRKNKKNSVKKTTDKKKDSNSKEVYEDLLTGPWITDAIKTEIDKMNSLKTKTAETTTSGENTPSGENKATASPTTSEEYEAQKKKVESMATAAKLEYIGNQPEDSDKSNAQVKDAIQPAEPTTSDKEATESVGGNSGEGAGIAAPAPTVTTANTTTSAESTPPDTDQDSQDDDDVNSDGDDFYCETCDCDWPTVDELESHLTEHETCGREGCTFSAHPKIIASHVRLQHDSGLYKKIVHNREDIDKWIAERKKRYPTKDRIDEKEEERKEKLARGEIPENVKPKFHSQDNKRGASFKKKTQQRRPKKVIGQLFENASLDILVIEGLPPDHEQYVFKKFCKTETDNVPSSSATQEEEAKGFSDSEKEVYATLSDDEWQTRIDQNERPKEPEMCSVLTALCSAYNTDSDDGADGPPAVEPVAKPCSSNSAFSRPAETVQPTIVAANSDDDDPPDEIKWKKPSSDDGDIDRRSNSEKSPDEATNKKKSKFDKLEISHKKTGKRKRADERTKHVRPAVKRPRSSTLLQKLLAQDIRHERNQILQCIRYAVKNQFFDKETIKDDVAERSDA